MGSKSECYTINNIFLGECSKYELGSLKRNFATRFLGI